jgi:hypothetical protein
VLAVLGATGLAPAAARAGTWTLVSCTLPSGQTAPTDGWSATWYGGSQTGGSGDVDTCAQGGSLSAIASGFGYGGEGPEWVFTAPPATTIAGGVVDATLTAPQGEAWIGTPGDSNQATDDFAYCAFTAPCPTETTAFSINHPGGTNIYAIARCIDPSSSNGECPPTDGTNAEVSIHSAEIELRNEALPAGSGFSGPLLNRRANGVADLLFTASDPNPPTATDPAPGSGPGVYWVTVALDGTTVYAGTPDTNGGACVSVAGGQSEGLMFDSEQPCRTVESVDVPVDTRKVNDGRHDLKVVVTDAAGNAATVLDRTVSTSNPTVTPRPRNPRRVRAQLTINWRWSGPHTRLRRIRARGLPPTAQIAVRCAGNGCPRLGLGTASAARVSTLWHSLQGRRFRSGDRLLITITAPGKLPERIELRIENGALPQARLLSRSGR